MEDAIFVGGGGDNYGTKQGLKLKYANRHGLVAGATGTGKTVTLQILAEGFSTPVFRYSFRMSKAISRGWRMPEARRSNFIRPFRTAQTQSALMTMNTQARQ